MQLLMALLVVMPIALVQWRMARLPAVGGTVEIATDGANGEIAHGHYHIALPIEVANHTDSPIFDVSLRVRAYACPSAARLVDCTMVVDTGQVVPMRVEPGGGGHFLGSLDGRAPTGTADGPLRVLSALDGLQDGVDRKREAEAQQPSPALQPWQLAPENGLQDKVDRSIMPS